ncbi:hypothetical protein GCM10009602_17850 [Nocardiopsis tropica]
MTAPCARGDGPSSVFCRGFLGACSPRTRGAARAIANATFAIRSETIWGQGSTAVGSDSTHVKAFDQNLFTEWHSRYGGRGALIYWHIEERSMAVHFQLLSCSASEVHAMVEGARRHGTSMNVEANYVDSHGQSEIDRWHAANPLHRQRSLRAFLTWARDTGRLPSRPAFPRLAITEGQRLAQHRRLELLRRVLDENAGPLRSRTAACLMLLFARPASRIVLLTTEDLIQDADGQVLIRLGDPPAPVPEPFADLLLQARDQRTNMNTNNRDATWLFPGRRAGRPMHPNSLADLVRDIGIPGTAARTFALRQLVLQAPAPVIAQALGFHSKTTTRVVAQAGGTWNRYAPSDHSQ